jgi:WD40 repeat protein
LTKGKEIWSFESRQVLREAVLSPDMKHLAFTDQGSPSRVYFSDNAKQPAEIGTHQNAIQCLAFSPDSKTLATGSLHTEKDAGEIILWDMEKRMMIARQEIPANCTALQFTPDGKWLFAVTNRPDKTNPQSGEGMVLYLQPTSGKIAGRLAGPSEKEKALIAAFAASPDGKMIAVRWRGADEEAEKKESKRLHIYARNSGNELLAPPVSGPVQALAFSRDGQRLAIGEDTTTVTVWEAVREKAKEPDPFSPVQDSRMEEIIEKDPIVVEYLKEIAQLEQFLAEYRRVTINPEKEPGYVRQQEALKEARKLLAARREELAQSLRK